MNHYHKLVRLFATGKGSDQLDTDIYACDKAKVSTLHYGESSCHYCNTPLTAAPMWVYTWHRKRSGKVVYKQESSY